MPRALTNIDLEAFVTTCRPNLPVSTGAKGRPAQPPHHFYGAKALFAGTSRFDLDVCRPPPWWASDPA